MKKLRVFGDRWSSLSFIIDRIQSDEKFRENTNTPVQTIFVMSPNVNNYYDSLVSYDTVYNYRFTAITMVVGNSYAYVNPIVQEGLAQVVATFVNSHQFSF